MFTKAQAEAYFVAEKQESLLFVVIGVLAIVAAIGLWATLKTPLARGMAIPILLIGLIQATVGYTVYSRSDAQRKDIVYKMDLDPDAIAQQELPRMKKVMDNFVIYRWIEIALLAAGLLAVVLCRQQPNRQWWFGVGLGLALQAAIMLAADYFAERRGKAYYEGLQAWAKSFSAKS
jgi:hypothetical protein